MPEMAYEERPDARIGDYDPSPADREPEWIDENQLRAAVRQALARIESRKIT